MKRAQVAVYFLFAYQYCHAAYIQLEPFGQVEQLNTDDIVWENDFDNHHIRTQTIKTLPSSLEVVEVDPNFTKEIRLFKRTRGAGRARRRAQARADKAEAKANGGTPNQEAKKPKAQQTATQHQPEPAKKGMSKTKAGLLVVGGAAAGAGAVHAMSGGGSGGGEPTAPPP